jgi:hypothetical protein
VFATLRISSGGTGLRRQISPSINNVGEHHSQLSLKALAAA